MSVGRHLLSALVLSSGFVFVQAAPAEARQCVWNKSGFVLLVDWYRPDDFIGAVENFTARAPGPGLVRTALSAGAQDESPQPPILGPGAVQGEADGRLRIYEEPPALQLRTDAHLIQRDIFPTAQGKCQRSSANLVAVMYCHYCELAGAGLRGTLIGLNFVLNVLGSGMATAAAGQFATELDKLMPTADLFMVAIPPTDRWLDVWGTAFSPQVGVGGTDWFDNNDTPTCSPCAD